MPLLAALSPERRSVLWTQARLRADQPGALLVAQGARADGLIVLLTGRLSGRHATPGGREVVLETWRAPAVADKVASFDGGVHDASIVADSHVTWCELPVRAVLDEIDRDPAAADHVRRRLARAASTARQSFADLATRSTSARVAGWLLSAQRADGSVAMSMPQERLALRLGMTRVTFNRAVRRLADEGWIARRRDTVLVIDADGLRRHAHG